MGMACHKHPEVTMERNADQNGWFCEKCPVKPLPISAFDFNKFYIMGFNDRMTLKRNGHVDGLDPENHTTNEYSAYVKGWNDADQTDTITNGF